MPVKKRESKRRSTDLSDIEWRWLIAAPDCNPFVGIGPGVHAQRLGLTLEEYFPWLQDLWTAHEAEVRKLWRRAGAPAALPSGHPLRVAAGEHFECVGEPRRGEPTQRCWRCQLAIRGEKVPPMPRELDPRWVLTMETAEVERWTARRRAWLHHGDPEVAA